MAEHTPGPWMLQEVISSAHAQWASAPEGHHAIGSQTDTLPHIDIRGGDKDSGLFGSGDGPCGLIGYVAEVPIPHNGRDVALANAALIAAAPDLLAEVERLRAEVERLRACLTFYANPQHYVEDKTGVSSITFDGGGKARDFLRDERVTEQTEVKRLRATSCPQEFVKRIADLLAYAAEELAEYSLTGYFRSFEHLEDRIEQALDQAVEYDLTEPRAC